MTRIFAVGASVLAMTFASVTAAETWTLDGDASRIAYGSIKKDKVGEVNSFSGLSGTVDATGAANITIDLATLETNIDIRNERMLEHVFRGAGEAQLAAQLDMDDVKGLGVGEMAVVDVEGALSLLGVSTELDLEMLVVRLAEDRVMAVSNDMVFVGTEELGVDAGIDKLMEIAKLPGITRTAPVTLRLVFTTDGQAAAAPAAAAAVQTAAVTGDVKAGKKVFRKCKACHKLEEGKNGAGPHLAGVIGRTAGAVDGFKYSKAMSGSGIVWDTETLTAFLTKPKKYLKGTKMAFGGLKKPEDIENVLAYIASEQ
ncbi:MAG: c-type cytochrome [Rhodobacteraceae bacterium]|nr:c-type cytochrome [Paracoccaceae bacterium]